MEKLINLLKTHKTIAILAPIILFISIAIIILFTNITLNHFKNLEELNTKVASNATILAGNIANSAENLLFVEKFTSNEKSEEEKKKEEEKEQQQKAKEKEEEERKAKEEAEKEKKEEEKIKTNTSSTTEKRSNVNANTYSSTNSNSSLNSYYIKINRQANTVTIYTKDANGNYTVPVRAMVCSTGYASPTGGVYSMRKLGTWHPLMGGVYGQYCTQITGDFLFHSVPYLRRGDNASLEYWAYDRLGTTASAGCVRLTTADAQWIYYNCSNGTQVEFYSSSIPGPLGKPSARKISNENAPYINWDPTDPNPNNPWRNKLAQTQPAQTQTQTQTQPQTNPQQSSTQNATNNSSVTVTSIENTTSKNNTTNTTNNSTTIKNNTTTNTTGNTNNSLNNSSNKTNSTSNNTSTNTNNTTTNVKTNNTINNSNKTTNTSNNQINSTNTTNQTKKTQNTSESKNK